MEANRGAKISSCNIISFSPVATRGQQILANIILIKQNGESYCLNELPARLDTHQEIISSSISPAMLGSFSQK